MFSGNDLLEEVCTRHYFRLNRQIRCHETQRQYIIALKDFGRSLGHAPTIADLSDDNVSTMMGMLDTDGISSRTINERRGRINAIWTWLCKRGVLSVWPTTAKLPEPIRSPLAWREDELKKLMAAASCLTGNYQGVPRWLWWTCLLGVLWNTGERIGALLQIDWNDVDLDGRWLMIAAEKRKGRRRDMVYRLSPEVVASLRMLKARGKTLVFEWPRNRSYLWEAFGRIIEAAGLPVIARQKFHRMRRSVASHMKNAGVDPRRSLGHSSEATTEKYLDPRIVESQQPCDVLFKLG